MEELKSSPLTKTANFGKLSNSYRAVSVLSREILIYPTLTKNLPKADYQHGFRSLHSTTTALSTLKFFYKQYFFYQNTS